MQRDPVEEARERKAACGYRETNRRAGITLIWIAAHLLFMCLSAATAENDLSRVLIVYQDSSVLKSSTEIAAGISQGLQKFPTGRWDLCTEFLDATRYSSVVETFGGKIWADNRPGGGAVFRFVLPLAEAT